MSLPRVRLPDSFDGLKLLSLLGQSQLLFFVDLFLQSNHIFLELLIFLFMFVSLFVGVSDLGLELDNFD